MKPINVIAERKPRSGVRVILYEASRHGGCHLSEDWQSHFQTPPYITEAEHRVAFDDITGYTPIV